MNKKIHILLADDDKYFRMAVKELLTDDAIFTEAQTELQALELIESNYFDIALIDMDIDGKKSGINILKRTKAKKIHSIILSSYNDTHLIEDAYNDGCDHFLAKLNYKSHLPAFIHKYKFKIFGKDTQEFFEQLYITNDEELKSAIDNICQINLRGKTIYLTGETGVGKSLIGKLLHDQSYNSEKPFVHINCSEISEQLIESELFGHVKGAFTGANETKIGKLELAHGGTLFLDEVGTMPKSMQQKLLKAIDQKSFYPVGSNREVIADFTLITATCDDLLQLIDENKFRKDLFYRISGINLHIKPLRERKNDIPLLIHHFLKSTPRRVIIKDEAITKLMNLSWPGNIRELKKFIEILSLHSSGIITANDIKHESPMKAETQSYLTIEQERYIDTYGLKEFIKQIEKESLTKSLDKHAGKITHVIKDLQISTSTFYRVFKDLNTSL